MPSTDLSFVTPDRAVRRQMNWDNSLLPRREALDRLWLRLCGMQLVLQATICDSLAFDPFAFEEQGFGSAKIDVSWG